MNINFREPLEGTAATVALPTRARVLFYLNHPSAATEYLCIAEELVRRGGDVTILCASLASARGVPAEKRASHRVIFAHGGPVDWAAVDTYATPATPEAPSMRRRVPLVRDAASFALSVVQLTRARRRIRAMLDKLAPDVLVANGDRRTTSDIPILVEAKRRGTPVVIIPFAEASPESLASYRQGTPELRLDARRGRFAKAIARRVLPRHVYAAPFGEFLFYDAPTMLALKAAGCAPRQPWVLGGGGFADAVAVLAHGDRAYFQDFGLPLDSVTVTGQPSLDALALVGAGRATLRAALIARYGFDPSRPLILCSLPQQWSEIENWSQADYHALIDTLAAGGASVLLSLHPKMGRGDYAFLPETAQVKFARERLVDILTAADAFVASYSSTMRWAMLLGIPAAIVDFPSYRERVTNPYPYVPVLTQADTLAAWLVSIRDPEEAARIRARLRAVAAETAPFDGRATARVADIITRLAKR